MTWDDRAIMPELLALSSVEKPTVDVLKPIVRALYDEHPAGCCLHIVLDDGNVEDGHVAFCIGYAIEHDHSGCALLAETLLRMSKTQRNKLFTWRGKHAWLRDTEGRDYVEIGRSGT